MNGLAGFVMALDELEKLMVMVQTLGFGHLHLDVTVPRAVIFRDAIMYHFTELAERFFTRRQKSLRRHTPSPRSPVPLSDRVSRDESSEGCPWRPGKVISGAVDRAEAMIKDLLTIRVDRDRCNLLHERDLFATHRQW